MNKHGHRVVWGVPNRPIYMSIELLWAYAKLHVTLLSILFSIHPEVKNMYDFGKKRTVKTLIKQVKQGWDGHVWTDEDIGDREHKPVTAQMCKSYIDHCVKELEVWLRANVGKLNAEFQPNRFENLKSN